MPRPPATKSKTSPRCLYVVHGWTYTLEPWQILVKALKSAGVEVIFLKVPGLTQKSRKVWTIDDYVKWLDKELSQVSRPVILGHSNGGRILLNYGLQHPNKLKHLILLSSAGVPPTRSTKLRLNILAFATKLTGPLRRITFLRRLVYRLLGVSDYNVAPINMKATLNNMWHSDYQLVHRLSELKTPVSIIWGEDDKSTPLSQGRRLQELLPRVISFQLLPATGHVPYITCPQQLKESILKALEIL